MWDLNKLYTEVEGAESTHISSYYGAGACLSCHWARGRAHPGEVSRSLQLVVVKLNVCCSSISVFKLILLENTVYSIGRQIDSVQLKIVIIPSNVYLEALAKC